MKPTGRPKESKNVGTIQIVETSACPVCGSTDRTKYRLASCVQHGGVTSSGREYTHVVSRRTSCTNCGRKRIDKYFERRHPAANPGDENEPENDLLLK